jgi:hypothetical protein
MMVQDLDDEAMYVVRNYRHLMTPVEQQVDRAFQFEEKMQRSNSPASAIMVEKMRQALEGAEAAQLFEKGRRRFLKVVAQRIEAEQGESMARCARCAGILRTPKARQCLHCGYDWH